MHYTSITKWRWNINRATCLWKNHLLNHTNTNYIMFTFYVLINIFIYIVDLVIKKRSAGFWSFITTVTYYCYSSSKSINFQLSIIARRTSLWFDLSVRLNACNSWSCNGLSHMRLCKTPRTAGGCRISNSVLFLRVHVLGLQAS